MMLRLLPALPCLLLLLSWPGPSSGSENDDTVVITTSGPIRGKRIQAGSGTVTAFLGIPYAQPPVGSLRFQKPLPHKPWSHVLEATSFGKACLQSPIIGYPNAEILTPQGPQSEDCLFLNVWVPHPLPSAPSPIFVWIHGGAYFAGAASVDLYDGRFLASTGNMIVVSMNYRLGALGFLSLPPAAPGNAGLWDQRLVLRWVQDNAAAFGGDPSRVMLAGQDAGAVSVGFHLLSPGSRSLFSRAVVQSGSPTTPWTWVSLEEAKERARTLGRLLGCSDGEEALVGCLQGKEAGEFPKHQFSVFHRKELLRLPFVPTIDGEFLSDTPPRLLQAMHGPPMPIAAGFTVNEGSNILIYYAPGFNLQNASSIGWEELLQLVRLMVPDASEEAVQAVAQRYSEDGKDQGEARYRWAMEQIVGDYGIVCPVAEVIRREVEIGSPVYPYYFAQRPSILSSPAWTGVPHGSELPYQFGTMAYLGGHNHTLTEAELQLIHNVMLFNAAFAETGIPLPKEFTKLQWPTYDPTKKNFERISLEPLQIEKASPIRHCEFLASQLTKKPRAPGGGLGRE
ncbi:acetylcholinesterase-like [Emydura macquarii macquarii]|uniref:acetylcholinesterase-like n=1 Tax=Emydura macquarii macquarii TaxID=1129001 RepID=UPI00352A312E